MHNFKDILNFSDLMLYHHEYTLTLYKQTHHLVPKIKEPKFKNKKNKHLISHAMSPLAGVSL